MTRRDLSAAELRSLVAYDPVTGAFTVSRHIPMSKRRVGDVLGSLCPKGYRRFPVKGFVYQAHHLAWLYVHGEWPIGEIDHFDGQRDNNRISNLRDVTRAVNVQNLRRARSDSASGMLGVSRDGGKWRAVIHVSGEQKYLGGFDTPEQAHAAYVAAKRVHHAGCTL